MRSGPCADCARRERRGRDALSAMALICWSSWVSCCAEAESAAVSPRMRTAVSILRTKRFMLIYDPDQVVLLGLCQPPSAAISASACFGPQVPRLYGRTRGWCLST